jgi:hypothetical protein
MAELEQTSIQDWVQRRISAVHEVYSAYDCLSEHGINDIPDKTTPTQIKCPLPEHGPDNRPSARFYPALGVRSDYVHCYKCHLSMDSINLHSKFKGLKFMEALQDLERRFRIRIPRRPDIQEYKEPTDRGSDYTSNQWADVPQVLKVLESKLKRMRDKVAMGDFVKFCRVLDAIQWDIDHNGNLSTPAMVAALQKLRTMMQTAEEEADAADAIGRVQDSSEHG